MSEKSKDLTQLVGQQKSTFEDTDIDSSDLTDQLKKLLAARYESDTKDRKWLAKWTAFVVSIWLGCVLATLALNKFLFYLSDAVLIALLGTTTLNVLGLSFIVLRGHFKASEK